MSTQTADRLGPSQTLSGALDFVQQRVAQLSARADALKTELDGLQDELRVSREQQRVLTELLGGDGSRTSSSEATITGEISTTGEASVDVPAVSETDGWAGLGRSEAVERVLRDAERPISPAEVRDRLALTGREGDTYQLISAALAYLKRQGRAGQPERGLWEVARTT